MENTFSREAKSPQVYTVFGFLAYILRSSALTPGLKRKSKNRPNAHAARHASTSLGIQSYLLRRYPDPAGTYMFHCLQSPDKVRLDPKGSGSRRTVRTRTTMGHAPCPEHNRTGTTGGPILPGTSSGSTPDRNGLVWLHHRIPKPLAVACVSSWRPLLPLFSASTGRHTRHTQVEPFD